MLAFLTDSDEDTSTSVGSSFSKIKTAAESIASQASGLFVQSKSQEDRSVLYVRCRNRPGPKPEPETLRI